jgi:hypothetical protein
MVLPGNEKVAWINDEHSNRTMDEFLLISCRSHRCRIILGYPSVFQMIKLCTGFLSKRIRRRCLSSFAGVHIERDCQKGPLMYPSVSEIAHELINPLKFPSPIPARSCIHLPKRPLLMFPTHRKSFFISTTPILKAWGIRIRFVMKVLGWYLSIWHYSFQNKGYGGVL